MTALMMLLLGSSSMFLNVLGLNHAITYLLICFTLGSFTEPLYSIGSFVSEMNSLKSDLVQVTHSLLSECEFAVHYESLTWRKIFKTIASNANCYTVPHYQ